MFDYSIALLIHQTAADDKHAGYGGAASQFQSGVLGTGPGGRTEPGRLHESALQPRLQGQSGAGPNCSGHTLKSIHKISNLVLSTTFQVPEDLKQQADKRIRALTTGTVYTYIMIENTLYMHTLYSMLSPGPTSIHNTFCLQHFVVSYTLSLY